MPRSSWKSFNGERCPAGWAWGNGGHISTCIVTHPMLYSFRGSNTKSFVWTLCVFSRANLTPLHPLSRGGRPGHNDYS